MGVGQVNFIAQHINLFVPSSRALDRGGAQHERTIIFLARTGHLRSARRRRPRSEESAQFAFLEGYAAVRAAGGPRGTPC